MAGVSWSRIRNWPGPTMESEPFVYVVAGPNGIGKSTSAYSVLPINIPIINADDIAKQLREELLDLNVQELANAEAVQRMNKYLARKESFGFETNLADNDTWEFLKRMNLIGYKVIIQFFCTDNIDLCINRVMSRTSEGGHFVREDIIRGRYHNAIRLLKHYKKVPNQLLLTDNSTVPIDICRIVNGEISFEDVPIPQWVMEILTEATISRPKDETIEEIRERYRRGKRE